MNHEINCKSNLKLILLTSCLIFLFATPVQAGSCYRSGEDNYGNCNLECFNAASANECGALQWDAHDCSASRRCQQGSFLGPIVGTPGASCEKIANEAEALECRKALCADGYTCNFGVCVFGKDNASEGDAAQAAAAGALPCNYTLDDIVQTGVNFSNILFGITGSLMLVFILYGGYQLFVSMGNAEEIQKAKQTLTMAFVGFMIVVGATIFVRFAGDLIGAGFERKSAGGLGETVIPRGSCIKQENDRQGPCASACIPANRATSCTPEAPSWLDGPCTSIRTCQ